MKLYTFIITTIFLIVTSCSTPRFITVQTLKPPKIFLPKPISEIVITKHSIYKFNTDSPVYRLKIYKIMEDSFNSGLKKELSLSPLSVNIKISVNSVKSYLDTLSKTAGNKHVVFIGLDSILFQDSLFFNKIINEDYAFDNQYQAIYNFCFRANAGIRTVNAKLIDSYWVSDTLEWAGYGVNSKEAFHDLPNIELAAGMAAKVAAGIYAKRIAPQWTPEERIIFQSWNRYMLKGYKKFIRGNFQEAIVPWKYIYHKGSDKVASNAAFNIALTYELMGDLESAETWLTRSEDLSRSAFTEKYMKIIKQLKENKDLLDKSLEPIN